MIITEEKYNEELTRCVLPFIRLNFEDGYMKSADGTRIHYGYVTTPVAKAAIVISHGLKFWPASCRWSASGTPSSWRTR